jgi:hypothetical protein
MLVALAIGSRVEIGDVGSGLSGRVTAVCIRGPAHVTYEVGWLNNGDYCSKWFEGFELFPVPDEPMFKIGFHPPEAK